MVISGSGPFCNYQQDASTGATACDEDQFSVPVVGPDGSLYVAFENEQNQACWAGSKFRNQYLMVKLTPTSRTTFSQSGPFQAVPCIIDGQNDYPKTKDGDQTLSNSNFRVNSAGNIALSPDGRKIYLVFSDNRNGTKAKTNTDVFFTQASTSNLASWSLPLRVNDDRPGFDQWFPWLHVADDGVLAVVFYDRRDDEGNKLANAYVAFSEDGVFWLNQRASNVSSNFDYGFRDGLFIGDYLGVDSKRCQAFAVWADARDATPATRFTDLIGARLVINAPGCAGSE